MKLRKELGLLEVFCISSGAMISSGLFILPAIAYAKTGSFVLISYLIAGILILPTVLSKAELTTAMPKTGGIFFFTDRSMGPVAGMLGGLAAWFSLAFKSAFALLGMGIFFMIFLPGIPMWQMKIIAVVFCVFFAGVNIFGVKLAGRFQVVIVIALIALLIGYVIFGTFFINISYYKPSATAGFGSIVATAGLVFISFAGTTKIAAVAGEVKNPGRNLPLGMLLSWGIVTLLYIAVIAVTIGLVHPSDLKVSLLPISLGGEILLGPIGLVLMGIAGLLAFISTGNAGILAASRDPMAMGKDHLLPKIFARISSRGTPWVAIIFTTGFMIAVIIFLDLETFVKTASTLKLTLFILANLSLIFMRESNMQHYRPKFKAPFYPWIQIIAIIAYGFLILQMGSLTLIIVGIFFGAGLLWYLIYARKKIKREYALLRVIERLLKVKSDHLLDEELREIIIERDDVGENRFKEKLDNCEVFDLNYFVSPQEFSEEVSKKLAKRLNMNKNDLYDKLIKREKDSNIIVSKDVAIISFNIKQKNKFEMALVRTKKGAMFKEDSEPVHAAFIIVASPDEQGFYLHSLMWMVQISESIEFRKKWMNAKSKKELRRIVLDAFRDQCKNSKNKR